MRSVNKLFTDRFLLKLYTVPSLPWLKSHNFRYIDHGDNVLSDWFEDALYKSKQYIILCSVNNSLFTSADAKY